MHTWLEVVLHLIWECSQVSTLEYVEIIAHYHKSLNKPRIDPRIKRLGYSKEQLDQLNAKFGKEKLRSLNVVITEPERFRCRHFNYYYELFCAFQKGVLPFEGPLTRQPAKIMEIFNVFTMLELERQERQQLEIERRNKSNGERRR